MFQSKEYSTAQDSEKTKRLVELIDLAALLNRQTEVTEIIRLITDRAASFLQGEQSFLLLINPRTRETIRTVNRLSRKTTDSLLHEVQKYTSGWIMRYRQNLLSEDLLHDERFKGIVIKNELYRSAMGIPVWNGSAIIGALILINKAGVGAFTTEDLDYCVQFGEIISPFLRQAEQFQMFFDHPVPDAQLLDKYAKLGLLGKSDKFLVLLKTIEAAARCDVRVILQGASGTGKELIAQAIHRNSERWSKPFVAIDCGAIPETLVESELMGHVKGAFTGAHNDRRGLFEEAHYGTLFMDEVVNLPFDIQAKLLRVLQEGEIRPVGSNKSRKVDVRVITAASTSLEKCVELGQFREDLYYRLFVFPIIVPALHERPEDIGLLADHFLKKFSAKQQKKIESFHPEVLDFIKRKNWPGNVRELENVVERLITMAPEGSRMLSKELLPPDILKEFKARSASAEEWDVERSLAEKVSIYEAELIRQALRQHDGNQSRAARALKIPAQTLHYKIDKLKIKLL